MPEIQVVYYQKENGEIPLRSFIDSLDVNMYFFVIGNKAVLTHGFTKKTQKTPIKEIDRAKRYRDDYMKQQEE